MTAGLETFAKVRALHDSTTSPGEKAAAAGRMEALAKAAGMTVKQAKSKLDKADRFAKSGGSKPQQHTQAQAAADAFNDFFNRPEWRAETARRHAEQQVRRAQILAEFGSIDAVYAETVREAALREACKPVTVPDPRPGWEGSYTLNGWKLLDSDASIPMPVLDAVRRGWPMPTTVKEAWAEYEASKALDRKRQTMHDYEHWPELWVMVRDRLLRNALAALPAASIGDMLARQSWIEAELEFGVVDETVLATLRADIERMGVQIRQARTSDEPRTMSADDNMGNSQVLNSPDLGTSSAADEGVPITEIPSHAADAMASRPSVFRTSSETGPTKSGLFDAGQDGQPQGYAQSAYPSRRTNADKRRDVLALLQANVGISHTAPLTDREIARRAGVSPQTVGNIRRSLP